MDVYIQSLEPNMSSTSTWMRSRNPLVENRKKLKGLGELLDCCLRDLSFIANKDVKEHFDLEVESLVDKVAKWVDLMERLE